MLGRRPSLSVVITTYSTNRLPDVVELLGSLKAQTRLPSEIIFVGEGDRGLCTAVDKYARDNGLSDVVILFNDGTPGLSAARNMGAAQATGDIVAFVDDDVILTPEWADEVVKTFIDDSVVGVTGSAYPLWDDTKMSWFPEEFDWLISCTRWVRWDRICAVRNGWGMNMAFRRSCLKLSGGFRLDFGLRSSRRTCWYDPPSEDVDLFVRIRRITGGRIVYNPAMRIYAKVNHRRLTMGYIIQRSFSIGYQRRMIRELYSKDEEPNRVLAQEHDLRDRIIRDLFPRIMKGIFTEPAIAFRQLSVAFVSLSFVLLGYYAPLVWPKMRSRASGPVTS